MKGVPFSPFSPFFPHTIFLNPPPGMRSCIRLLKTPYKVMPQEPESYLGRVPLTMAYKEELRMKGVPFSSFRYMKG